MQFLMDADFCLCVIEALTESLYVLLTSALAARNTWTVTGFMGLVDAKNAATQVNAEGKSGYRWWSVGDKTMPIISERTTHPRLLSLLAAVGGLLPPGPARELEKSARQFHERESILRHPWHCHFRFEHCPESVCFHARELKEALTRECAA
jgi:hypothetical protein